MTEQIKNDYCKIIDIALNDFLLEKNENSNKEFNEFLNSIFFPYKNKNIVNIYYQMFKNIEKNNKFNYFLELLENCENLNKNILFILKNCLFMFLNNFSCMKNEKNYSIKIINFLIKNFHLELNKKDDLKLINFFNQKNKIEKNFNENFINSFIINKEKNYINIYLIGILLQNNNNKNNKILNDEIKNNLSKFFSDYFINNILELENFNKKIIYLKQYSKFLSFLNENDFNNLLNNKIFDLLNHSKKNFIFLNLIILNYFNDFEDDFLNNFLIKFEDFFFSKEEFDKNNNKLIIETFNSIINKSNKIFLINFLLNKEILNKNQKFFIINYLANILNKNSNNLNNENIISILIYIFNNLDEIKINETKIILEKLIENLINNCENNNNNKNESKESEIIKLLFNLIKNKNYDDLKNYFYMILLILSSKFNLNLNDNILNINEFNIEILFKNFNLILAYFSLVLNISINNKDYYKNNLKIINENIEKIIQIKINENNFNLIDKFNKICYYSIINSLINLKNENFSNEILCENLCYLLFNNVNNLCEIKIFNDLLENILKNEEFSLILINKIFYILLFKENEIKLNFNKISIFIEKNLNNKKIKEKNFLKFLILLFIPNNHLNKKKHSKNFYIKNIFKNKEKKEFLIKNIELNINLISNFLFSNFGIFNIKNDLFSNSSFEIINFILNFTNFGLNLIKFSFDKINFKEFKFVDNLIKFYDKNLDLIKKFDLIEFYKTLKSIENSFNLKQTKNENNFDNKINDENLNKKNEKNKKFNKKNKNNNFNKKNNKKEEKKEEKKEKFDLNEIKNFIIYFIYKSKNNLFFIIERLIKILNYLKIDSKNFSENFKIIIEKFWELLNCDFLSKFIIYKINNFLEKNPLSKNYSNEFSLLMFLSKNSEKFNEIYDKNPNLISDFNQKLLENFQNLNNENFFKNFDFIIIKILFFIILNKNIQIEFIIESVENLIKLLNLNYLNFDSISDLLINLLKSDYTGQNIKILLKLFYQNSPKKFINLVQEILNYEYISKFSVLNTIFDLNIIEIKNFEDINFKIFILCFDENENISKISIKIFNKFNLIINENFLNSNYFELAMKEHISNLSVRRALIALVNFKPELINKVIEIYKEFYLKELNENLEEKEENLEDNEENENEEEEEEKEEKIYLHLRIILLEFINETIEIIDLNLKCDLIMFLIVNNEKEFEDEFFDKIFECLKNLCLNINEYEKIILFLNDFIEKIDINNFNKNNLKNVLKILSLINSKKNSNNLKEKTFNILLNLSLKINSYEILLLIFENIYLISNEIKNVSEKILLNIFNKLKSNSYKLNEGEIFVFSGIIKSFGIKILKNLKILDFFSENLNEKNSNKNILLNCITTLKILYISLNKLFEPFFIFYFEKIYKLIICRDDKIRNFSLENFKFLIKTLSNFGISQIMKYLILDFNNYHTKIKISIIEILGQISFCAPKILNNFLPNIISQILKILKDPQENVQKISEIVLKDISTSIVNPEIVEISEILIDAISNPYEKGKFALEALLETNFNHKLDTPTLALIIPILDYNLKTQNDKLKKMASHILGSLPEILINKYDLNKYENILIPDLKNCIFESSPETRNELSKTFGKLYEIFNKKDEIKSFIIKYLENEREINELTACAQLYSEILFNDKENLKENLNKIIEKIKNGNDLIKEGYLSIFVFLPNCFESKENFYEIFDLIFDIIIKHFSEKNENIRKITTKIYEIFIKLISEKNVNKLIFPLLDNFYNENDLIRNNSLALIKTLINNFENDFKNKNSIFFSEEIKNSILIKSFILKGDNFNNTSTLSNIIWRDYVENIPKYISKSINQIFEEIIYNFDHNKEKICEIFENFIRIFSKKFHDKFFNELMPILIEFIKNEENKKNIKLIENCYLIVNISIEENSEKILQSNKNKIIEIINSNLDTNSNLIKKLISEITYKLSIKINEKIMNKILIFNIIKLNKNYEIITNLVEIADKNVLKIVLNEILKTPFNNELIKISKNISHKIFEFNEDKIDQQNLFKNLAEMFMQTDKNLIDNINFISSVIIKYEKKDILILNDFFEKIIDKIKNEKYLKFNVENYYYNLINLIIFYCEYYNKIIKKNTIKIFDLLFSIQNYKNYENFQKCFYNILFYSELITVNEEESDSKIIEILLNHNNLDIYEGEFQIFLFNYVVKLMKISKISADLLVKCLLIIIKSENNNDKNNIINICKNFINENNSIEIIEMFLNKILK